MRPHVLALAPVGATAGASLYLLALALAALSLNSKCRQTYRERRLLAYHPPVPRTISPTTATAMTA